MLLSSSERILFPVPSYPWTLAVTGSRYEVSLELPRFSMRYLPITRVSYVRLLPLAVTESVPSSPKISPKAVYREFPPSCTSSLLN